MVGVNCQGAAITGTRYGREGHGEHTPSASNQLETAERGFFRLSFLFHLREFLPAHCQVTCGCLRSETLSFRSSNTIPPNIQKTGPRVRRDKDSGSLQSGGKRSSTGQLTELAQKNTVFSPARLEPIPPLIKRAEKNEKGP